MNTDKRQTISRSFPTTNVKAFRKKFTVDSGSRRATITFYTFWLIHLGCYITINYSVTIFNKNSTNFAGVVMTRLVIRGKDGSDKVPQNEKCGGTKFGNKKQSGIEVAFVVCLCMNLCISLSFSLSFGDFRDPHPDLLSASLLYRPHSLGPQPYKCYAGLSGGLSTQFPEANLLRL